MKRDILYETPEMQILRFKGKEDVVTTSVPTIDNDEWGEDIFDY